MIEGDKATSQRFKEVKFLVQVYPYHIAVPNMIITSKLN